MFCRSVNGLICVFMIAVIATGYSDSASITETYTTELVPEAEEKADVDLGALLAAGDGALVTLVAGETRIAAHRAVLASQSSALAAMLHFNAPGALGDQVAITDVEGPVLQQLVAFLYSRRSPRLQQLSAALHLLEAADRYGVPELRAACERQAASLVSADTAAATAVLAVGRGYTALADATVAFMRENVLQVLATPGWKHAMRNHTDQLLQVIQLLAYPTSDCHQCCRRRATAPPVPAACPTASRPTFNLSSLWSVPAEKKGMWLIEAAKVGAIEELRALLAAGADTRMMDEEDEGDVSRRAALHWAAWVGDPEAVRALLDAGVDTDIRTSHQYTPLMLAAWRGNVEVVRMLLAECAELNAGNQWGWTPLHEAAGNGHPDVAEVLLEAGANVRARTDDGETPLDVAMRAKRYRVAKVLLKALGCEHRASELLPNYFI